jgi:hypothetical protein
MRLGADSTITPLRVACLAALWLLPVAGAEAQGTRRAPTVLWTSCATDQDARPLTLHDLAVRARPALWFSRDEPLLDLTGPLPREWPRRDPRTATPEDLVYYRVTVIKSRSSDEALARALQERIPGEALGAVTADGANPEVLAAIPLDEALLGHVTEIVVRYLFYYPNELGAHSHRHDLESVELRLVSERADDRGDPRVVDGRCRQVRVATFYGAAHGLGLYTNVLDLDRVLRDRLAEREIVAESTSRRTPVAPGPAGVAPMPSVVAAPPPTVERFSLTDPFWPLIVLVEEGKHASAPDRNGDGVFTPNYDVNRFAADAWGVRDTMRSRQLSPAFRGDTFKKRIPEISVDAAGTLRASQAQDPWAVQAFSRYVRYDYRLRRATADQEICGDPGAGVRERRLALKAYASDLLQQLHEGQPERLLVGKAFCDDVNVQSSVTAVDVMERLSFGGAHNGFTRWWERISGSARFDGGSGWAATLPIGVQVPGVGGWLVGRFSGPWPGTDARKSVDAAYMPSASRFADWYAAVGIDYGHFESDAGIETGSRFAVETGVKFRFPLPDWGTFFGGRIGLRANGRNAISNQRLVFEVGAGIW